MDFFWLYDRVFIYSEFVMEKSQQKICRLIIVVSGLLITSLMDSQTLNSQPWVCFSGRMTLDAAAFRKPQSSLIFSNLLYENRIFDDEKYYELCMGEHY